MLNDKLERLVGCRFSDLSELKHFMITALEIDVDVIIFSESEKLSKADHMIDGELKDGKAFTIFYLFDNNKKFVITEV